MEFVSELSGRWLEVLVAVYLIGMILYGHYRGFIRLAVSLLSLVIALTAVSAAMPYVTDWLKNDTSFYESVKAGAERMAGFSDEPEIEEGAEGESAPEDVQEPSAMAGIEDLTLPEQLKRLLTENNTEEVYERLGVSAFQDYVGGYLADMMLRILVFVALFLVIFIGLRILVVWLDLIAKLPIFSGLNQIAGAILGGVEGLIFVWIGCLVLTLFSGTGPGLQVMGQIDASAWLSWLYDHNLLSYLVVGLLAIGF